MRTNLMAATTLALITTLMGGPAAAAPAAGTQASTAQTSALATTSDERAPRTTTRRVRLGHDPIRGRTRGKLRLVFNGKRGQLVNVALLGGPPPCARRTLVRNGKRVSRWADGFWRLPRNGRYVAVLRWCSHPGYVDGPGRVQLRRTVTTRVPADGTSVTTPNRRRVTHLAAVHVDRPLMLAKGKAVGPFAGVILPDRRTTPEITHERFLFLAPGIVTHSTWSESGPLLSTRGRHLVTVPPNTPLTVQPSLVQQTAIDGPPTTQTTTSDHSHQVVEFSGQAGQWIHAETVGSGRTTWPLDDVLVGPDGQVVTDFVSPSTCSELYEPCDRDKYAYRLPTTGTYRFGRLNEKGTETLRIRAAAQAPPIVAGGAPVTYTSSTPGQWVVGAIPHPDPAVTPTLRASNASSTLTDFTATAVSSLMMWCRPFDSANGCGDLDRISVTPAQPEATGPWLRGRDPVIVVQVPPTVQGAVDLTWP